MINSDKQEKQQIVISKQFSNLARCEDKLLLWNCHIPETIQDAFLSIEYLDLWNIEVFSKKFEDVNREIYNKITEHQIQVYG